MSDNPHDRLFIVVFISEQLDIHRPSMYSSHSPDPTTRGVFFLFFLFFQKKVLSDLITTFWLARGNVLRAHNGPYSYDISSPT